MQLFMSSFALVFMAASLTAAGQSLPPGVTMHQLQAGTLDAEGWTAAASTAGSFSLKMPCLFNDFTTQVDDPAAPMLKAYSVGCLRSDQRKFSATRIVYKGGAPMAKEYFAKIRSGDGLKGPAVTALDFKGFKALDIVDTNDSRCGFIRYVLVDADMVALIVEAPRSACDGLKEQSDKFFASVNFDK
jgi:hypothetical protein